MKIKIAQLNPIIGDFKGNTEKIIKIIDETHNVDFLIFPETAISGYAPVDLLERVGFVDNQNIYLEKIKKATGNGLPYTIANNVNVVIGAFSKNESAGKDLYNTLYIFRHGREVLKYNKICLPTYNVFDEYRHCEPGDTTQIINSTNVLEWDGKRIAFLICEDALSSEREEKSLYKFDPVKETFRNAKEKIDYFFTINASPSNIGKFQLREKIYRNICTKYSVTAVYVNQVGAQDEIIYDGQSFVMDPEGEFKYVAIPLSEDIKTVDFDSTRAILPPGINYIKEKFYYEHIVLGIKDYFHKQGFTKAVVGCSGGIDSAVVTYFLSKSLGPENVIAITIPSNVSSEGSIIDSEKLCGNLFVELKKFPIGELFEKYLEVRENSLGELPKKSVTKQNIQPRFRTMVLMDLANENNAILINCSNKTELTYGYGTSAGGDLEGFLSPLGAVLKTDVFLLAKYINKRNRREIIPVEIINKIPSAELEKDQIDTNDLGCSYEVADCISKLFIDQNMLSKEEMYYCQSYLKENSSRELIEKTINKINKSEFKRKQFCPIIRLNNKDFGNGRRIPIVNKYDILKYEHPLLNMFN